MGFFGVWNYNPDGLDWQLKLANACQSKDVDITRDVVGSSEAGKGSTQLTAESYVSELSYAFDQGSNTLLRPYLAARYTLIEQDGYTERNVSTPLTVAALKDRSTSILAGITCMTGSHRRRRSPAAWAWSRTSDTRSPATRQAALPA